MRATTTGYELMDISKYMNERYDAWYTKEELDVIREKLEKQKQKDLVVMKEMMMEINKRVAISVEEEMNRRKEQDSWSQSKKQTKQHHGNKKKWNEQSQTSTKHTNQKRWNKEDKTVNDNTNSGNRKNWNKEDRSLNRNKNSANRKNWQNQEKTAHTPKDQRQEQGEEQKLTTKDVRQGYRNEKNHPKNNRLLEKKSSNEEQHVKTKMCKFVLEGKSCMYKVCNFAHSIAELTPYDCMFDTNCRKGNSCPYFHSRETMQEYVSRVSVV